MREHDAPIVGRISLDLTLADVTGLPGVSVGDEVVLLGALDGLSKELIYLAVSITNSCDYCINTHAAAARAKGMTTHSSASCWR